MNHDEPVPWTEAARGPLSATAATLAEAILIHANVLEQAAAIVADPVQAVTDADDGLMPALAAYTEAVYQLTSEVSVLDPGDEQPWLAGDDEPDQGGAAHAPEHLTVLQRQDYVITDPAAVLGAGRDAQARLGNELESDLPPTDLGYALYSIAHERGWSALEHTSGLRPLGGVVALIPTEQPLPPAGPSTDVGDTFAASGPPIFIASDVYFR